MFVKSPIPQPLPVHDPHPVKERMHAPDAAASTAAASTDAALRALAGKSAETLGAMQLTSLAAFHELVGIVHGREPGARQARQPQQSGAPGQQRTAGLPARSAARQRGQPGLQPQPGAREEAEEDSLLGKTASSILARLKDGASSDQLQQNLEDQHDPLERYRFFQEALKKLRSEEQSDEDKEPTRRKLLQLLRELDAKHGPAIREGLEATGDMHALLKSLGDASADAVRGWFGTAKTGNTFGPLTPIDLAIRLSDAFGAANFAHALSQLGQKAAKSLSVRNHRIATEPPLMALSDTRAFTVVRSCHAKAQELMRELGEVNVIPRDGQGSVELAVALMKMASGSKEQALYLADSLIDWKKLSERQQSRAWKVVRKALDDLPASLWPQDAGVKPAVLNEIGDRVRELDEKSPRAAVDPAVKKEAELREMSRERAGKAASRDGK